MAAPSIVSNREAPADSLAGHSDAEIGRIIHEGRWPDSKPMLPPIPGGHIVAHTPEQLAEVMLQRRSLSPTPDAAD